MRIHTNITTTTTQQQNDRNQQILLTDICQSHWSQMPNKSTWTKRIEYSSSASKKYKLPLKIFIILG